MLQNSTNPEVEQGLNHCIVKYGGSLAALLESLIGVDESNYKEAGKYSGIAFENTRDCERAFIDGPTHFSPLTSRNQKMWLLSDTSDVIFGNLLLCP